MLIEIIKYFQDDATHKRVVRVGEILEFPEKRAKALISGGLAKESGASKESVAVPTPPDIGQAAAMPGNEEEAAPAAKTSSKKEK